MLTNTFFQLLMPHLKNSLQINIQARASLLAANGVFDKVGLITFN